jgi:uncharacterized membrane protein
MMSKQIVFALVTFLHDLFTVAWVGGLLTLGVVVIPTTLKVLGRTPTTRQLLAAIRERLSHMVYISIVGLAVTGILLSQRAPGFQGLMRFGTPYGTVLGIKHVLYLAMVVIALVRSLALRQNEKASMALLYLNLALGVIVLLLSGLSTALSG